MSIIGWLVLAVIAIKAASKGHKRTQKTLLADWVDEQNSFIANKAVSFLLITAGAIAVLTLKFVVGLLELAYDARYWLDKNLGELGYNLKHNPKGCGVPEPAPTTSEKADMEYRGLTSPLPKAPD